MLATKYSATSPRETDTQCATILGPQSPCHLQQKRPPGTKAHDKLAKTEGEHKGLKQTGKVKWDTGETN